MRKIRSIGLAAVGVSLVGCYTLQPTGGVLPPIGTTVAFDLNDAGRLALGGSMGPEIGQIEGRLVSLDSSDYVIAVTAVRYLRSGEQTWRGEQVHVKPQYVSTVHERTFSRGRSILASAVGIGAAVLLGSQTISTVFTPGEDGKIPTDSQHTVRIPRP